MVGLREQAVNAAKSMRRGGFIIGNFAVDMLLEQAPIEVRVAFDMAIERADFVRAADVVEHEWKTT